MKSYHTRMLSHIKIITRQSLLARIQGQSVGDKIKTFFPGIEISYHTSKSAGDINQNLDLKSSESRGVFTSNISEHIISRKYDIAVHSWKDYPTQGTQYTGVVGTLSRKDSRDILFVKKDSIKNDHKKSFSVLTSSPRRRYGLEKVLKQIVPFKFDNLIFRDLRGNIDSRLKKFLNSEEDAVVIAKAAIDRIMESKRVNSDIKDQISYCMEDCKWIILPLSIYPTAPGQGALGIEARLDNTQLIRIIKKINNNIDYKHVQRERAILSKYGGGCSQKIGVSIWGKNGVTIQSLSGITEEGELINFYGTINRKISSNSKPVPTENVFPNSSKERSLYKRISYSQNELIENIENSIVYLSRRNVLDKKPTIDSSNVLWSSGLTTWYNVVKNGYWVNGSSESLGELEVNKLEPMLNNKNSLIKLTFSNKSDSSNNIIDTYRLEDLTFPGDFQKRTHFFWTSPILFQLALKKYPEIINRDHSCGMGNTYDNLAKILGDQVKCFLSYKEWFETTTINNLN